MSELPTNIEQQKRNGYLMLAGAGLLIVGGAVVVGLSSLPPVSYLGVFVPVSILVFFGYRAVSAGRSQKALGDERTAKLHGKVGVNSFWMLLFVILADGQLTVVPPEGASTAYIFAGLFFYGAYFVYYRYIERA
ncbi:hypothetical protein [Natronorubrum daqingense]|uniref:DUF2178 domain-containing protein n=1 Tax=Natronorubrum daqingense TaxID=588898 RepID=A0A1N7DW29_9EURY|nr:hypothetical protein [Natronorubrum daqingense]APX96212.1 hypothetical protein BB347_06000 [Natronorubrum daqingense]SIR80023.1 hypothetical protein SAMN05421809_2282 [Natronorubrum daqingense]